MDDFLEKMEAMRMTLELAVHDVEAQRVSIRELRENSEVLLKSTENLLTAVAAHQNDLRNVEEDYKRTRKDRRKNHDRRLNVIEGPI